ncbi:MAG: signal peptide peptidase SppA [Planctomycetes bacterium]|nr:signal peptide peptidase SppA [Planctomycetota bacterium]
MSDPTGVPLMFPSQQPLPHPQAPAPARATRSLNLAGCLMIATLVGSLTLNGVMFFLLLGALAGGGSFRADGVTERHVVGVENSSHKIVVIPVKGVISSGGGSPLLGPTADVVERAIADLRRVKDDTSVVAVILDVNSPGGGITDCDRIHHEILELKKARPALRFVSLMRDVAASGGYYVSAPCDRIVAHPTTITGSIGVIMSFMNLEGLFEKIGYREVVIKSAEHKDIGSMGRPMTEKERELLQSMLNEMYDRFVQIVADGRKMDVQKVRELADGRIYTGSQAKANGLVDELGYFDQAVDAAMKLAGVADANVIEYQKPFTIQDLLRAQAQPPSAESAIAAELRRITGHKGGFYYLWTVEGGGR